MTITREPWVQTEGADKLEEMIKAWEHIIPPTFSRISISSDTEQECPMLINVNDEYRSATIYIGPSWYENRSRDAEATVVHELCHLYTTPIARRAREAYDILSEKDSLPNKLAWDAITKICECCPEDLCQTFLRLKHGPERQ